MLGFKSVVAFIFCLSCLFLLSCLPMDYPEFLLMQFNPQCSESILLYSFLVLTLAITNYVFNSPPSLLISEFYYFKEIVETLPTIITLPPLLTIQLSQITSPPQKCSNFFLRSDIIFLTSSLISSVINCCLAAYSLVPRVCVFLQFFSYKGFPISKAL